MSGPNGLREIFLGRRSEKAGVGSQLRAVSSGSANVYGRMIRTMPGRRVAMFELARLSAVTVVL